MNQEEQFAYELETKVYQLLYDGGKDFSLQNFHIPSLPDEVLKCSHLQTLSIENCYLESFHFDLHRLVNLWGLFLDKNSLYAVPSQISNLSNLRKLYIRNNKNLAVIPPDCFDGSYSTLEELYLSGNQIHTLHNCVSKLTKLKELGTLFHLMNNNKDLARNLLKDLPLELTSLVSLEVLKLERNQFTSIPQCILKLSTLEQLFIGNQNISSLPEEISKLSRLKKLYCGKAQLIEVKSGFSSLTNLQLLHLQENRLKRLPDADFPKLQHVELAINEFVEFPRMLFNCKLLKVIVLEANSISEIPKEINTISNLKGLNLAQNQLKEIPIELCQLSFLEYLKLSKNSISQLPEEIGNLSRLAVFDIDHNQLTSIPSSIGLLSRLESLSLDCNKLSRLPREITELTDCDISLDSNPLEHPLLGLYFLGIKPLFEYLKDPSAKVTHGSHEIAWNSLELKQVLGHGGFGTVYKALWHKIDKQGNINTKEVAVKVPKVKKIDAEFLDKFRREVGMLRKTILSFAFPGTSAFFIRYFGACTQPPHLCIVTEFAHRGSLYDVIHRYSKLDFSYVLQVARQVAVGMNNLHSFVPDAILHHDLKTKNILVMDDWSIRISDFGLSRTSLMIGLKSSTDIDPNSNGNASMKEEEDFRKTTAYIPSTAPEVLSGGRYSKAADVFSYGCLIYETYTQEVSFHGLNNSEIKLRVIAGERPPIPFGCPPLFGQLIVECWDQEPSKRPDFQYIISVLNSMGEEEVKFPKDTDIKVNSLRASSPSLEGYLDVTLLQQDETTGLNASSEEFIEPADGYLKNVE